MRGVFLLLDKAHFPLIRTAAFAALAAVGATATLHALVHWAATRVEQHHAALQQQRTALEAQLAEAHQVRRDLDRNLGRYRDLAASGFIGEGDRLAWTEVLVAQQRALGLPPVQFEMTPRRSLSAATTPIPEGQPNANVPGPQAHDLRFALTGVHENQLIALVEALRAQRIGHFRVQDCLLTRRYDGRGLDADCTLRWITFLPAASASTVGGGQ